MMTSSGRCRSAARNGRRAAMLSTKYPPMPGRERTGLSLTRLEAALTLARKRGLLADDA
jgi:DNA-binding IclR family transcriptional regulator